MILRYLKIREILSLLEIDELVLSAKENHNIDAVLQELEDLASVC
jgi:hypothetical protein